MTICLCVHFAELLAQLFLQDAEASCAVHLKMEVNMAVSVQEKDTEAKNPKRKSEIPIPLVRDVGTYKREYLPIFQRQNTYIRGRGDLEWLNYSKKACFVYNWIVYTTNLTTSHSHTPVCRCFEEVFFTCRWRWLQG